MPTDNLPRVIAVTFAVSSLVIGPRVNYCGTDPLGEIKLVDLVESSCFGFF